MKTKGYLLHDFGNGEIALCRVIREYSKDEEDKATKDWVDLTMGKVSEKKLSKNGLMMDREGI